MAAPIGGSLEVQGRFDLDAKYQVQSITNLDDGLIFDGLRRFVKDNQKNYTRRNGVWTDDAGTPVDLSNYYTKSQVYSKTQDDLLLSGKQPTILAEINVSILDQTTYTAPRNWLGNKVLVSKNKLLTLTLPSITLADVPGLLIIQNNPGTSINRLKIQFPEQALEVGESIEFNIISVDNVKPDGTTEKIAVYKLRNKIANTYISYSLAEAAKLATTSDIRVGALYFIVGLWNGESNPSTIIVNGQSVTKFFTTGKVIDSSGVSWDIKNIDINAATYSLSPTFIPIKSNQVPQDAQGIVGLNLEDSILWLANNRCCGGTTPPATTVTISNVVVNDQMVTITGSSSDNSQVEYSLDGTTYQASSIFTNVTPGTYNNVTIRKVGSTTITYKWPNPVVVNNPSPTETITIQDVQGDDSVAITGASAS